LGWRGGGDGIINVVVCTFGTWFKYAIFKNILLHFIAFKQVVDVGGWSHFIGGTMLVTKKKTFLTIHR
jgi:hypothetical protein